MESFPCLLAFVIVAAAIWALIYGIIQIDKTSAERGAALRDHLAQIKDFTVTQQVFGIDDSGLTGLAIDEERKKVCLIDRPQQTISTRVVAYKDLLASELFEDGVTITKTNRTSQIGGALLGGLALGGVGAIIGGLSGRTQTTGKVRKIELRITVNDTKKPIHHVSFQDSEQAKESMNYQCAIKLARHWHGLVEVLIKQADMEDKVNITNDRSKIRETSVADEIKKLAELRDAGLLSAEEFQQQKARLLRS